MDTERDIEHLHHDAALDQRVLESLPTWECGLKYERRTPSEGSPIEVSLPGERIETAP